MPVSFSIPIPWSPLVARVCASYETRDAASRFGALVNALIRSVATGRWEEAEQLVAEGRQGWAQGLRGHEQWNNYIVLAERTRVAQWEKCPELVQMHESAATRREHPHLESTLPPLLHGTPQPAMPLLLVTAATPTPLHSSALATSPPVLAPEGQTGTASAEIEGPSGSGAMHVPTPPAQSFPALRPRPLLPATPSPLTSTTLLSPQNPRERAEQKERTAAKRAAPDINRAFVYNVEGGLGNDDNHITEAVDKTTAVVMGGTLDGLPTKPTHGWTPLNKTSSSSAKPAVKKATTDTEAELAARPVKRLQHATPTKLSTSRRRNDSLMDMSVAARKTDAQLGSLGGSATASIPKNTKRILQAPSSGKTRRRATQDDKGEVIMVARPKVRIAGKGNEKDPITFEDSDGSSEFTPMSSDEGEPAQPRVKRRKATTAQTATAPTRKRCIAEKTKRS